MIIKAYMLYLLCMLLAITSIITTFIDFVIINPAIDLIYSLIPLVIWCIAYFWLEPKEKKELLHELEK